MQIPFHRSYITDDEINAVVKVMRGGWITMGHKTMEFESLFNNYLGTKISLACNSGTAALHLSLKCIDLKPGEEVIIPATTFTATAEVVRYFDANPVMVDINKDTHLIDISKVEEKITQKTRAIIPVHFSGQPADMDEIMNIANNHNLKVIEDAAHSLPAKYKNKFIGAIGHLTCFSFYATKTLTTGEGGMISTDNEEWADKIKILRLHGISRDAWKRYTSEGSWEYDVIEAGFKYNTTDINAAIGIEQLKKLNFMNEKRSELARLYNNAFKNMDSIILYRVKEDRETAWQLYPLKLKLETLKIDRNQFIQEMKNRGIGTSVHFIPLYRFTYYKKLGFNALDYPESEWVYNRVVSLPIFPDMKENEIDYVIENTLDILKKNRR